MRASGKDKEHSHDSIDGSPLAIMGKNDHEDTPRLSEGEQQQLAAWDAAHQRYPLDTCVQSLIEEQANIRPHAVALVAGNQTLSYQDVNRHANQLAHYLRASGVGPNVLVGLCIERSLEMVIGLLGILKAGGAYVPLDPTYPAERLAFMVEDAQAPILVTQQHLMAKLPTSTTRTICLDADGPLLAKQSQSNPPATATGDDLVYVIYTSGSTGRPKGVQITHTGLLNLIFWHHHAFGVCAADRATQIASPAFDATGWELWPYLSMGASVYLVDEQIRTLPILLRDWLVSNRITISFLPTALAESVLALEWPHETALRYLLTGADTLHQYPGATLPFALINNYGPTEATVVATSGRISPVEQADTPPSIGRPITNTQVFILDEYLRQVPIGVPGELFISGAGLARGYLNRPELTAEKFIPHPFNDEPGARLYRTGDLVRYLPDGQIAFLGRVDHQIKIRGYRIEPDEIVSVLNRHPAVQTSYVIAREDAPGEKRLVVYVVPRQNSLSTQDEQDENVAREQVSHWQRALDETYHAASSGEDPTFNTIGWISSYTGLAIPAEEMREWVEQTVDRILALHPAKVLEIGCGTGLLLFRIAPHCTHYCGTDFAPKVLRALQEVLARPEHMLPQVTLLERTAEDFTGLEGARFDTVILNSVVQYFPHINYLLTVLQRAMQAVAPGGHIILGDVRSLPLLEILHTSVELHCASDMLSIAALEERIQERLAQEEELAIDPAFFYALQQAYPQICQVDVLVKRGCHQNELTRYRYDVVLHLSKQELDPQDGHGPDQSAKQPFWLDGHSSAYTVAGIRQLLAETKPELLAIAGVPNARLLTNLRAHALLHDSPTHLETVDDLHRILQESSAEGGIDPEALWALSEELPYSVDIRWSGSGAEGGYDVVFRRLTANGSPTSVRVAPSHAEKLAHPKPWHLYANNPLREKLMRLLVPTWRSYLQERLPQYMVPAAFVALDALPLSPNGKVDRAALPPPNETNTLRDESFSAPNTLTEEKVAEIVSALLHVEQVGIDSNFFLLGGHSMLGAQLIVQISHAFGVELPLRTLFEAPTVRQLATEVERRLLAELEAISEAESHHSLG